MYVYEGPNVTTLGLESVEVRGSLFVCYSGMKENTY